MNEGTRVVRLGQGVSRDEADNDCTRLPPSRARPPLDVRAVFNSAHAHLAPIVSAERRPGFFIFALNSAGAQVGRVWLHATPELRAATIGRHGHADLHLPGSGDLSLRHCLVLVHLRDGRPRADVLDLDSELGLSDEAEHPVGAVESEGSFFLRLPGLLLFFAPSGAGLPWSPLAPDAFSTLPPRKVVQQPRTPGRCARPEPLEVTVVRVSDSPLHSRDLKRSGEPALGNLVLESEGVSLSLPVGLSALERGVVLGRYERCVGYELLGSNGSVSRVHACLVLRGEQVVLVDAGSTNGLTRDLHAVRCEPIVPRARYLLHHDAFALWEPAPGAA